jgi:hypothetical protein
VRVKQAALRREVATTGEAGGCVAVEGNGLKSLTTTLRQAGNM